MRGYQRGHLRAGGGHHPSWQARPGSGKNQVRSTQGKEDSEEERRKNGRHFAVSAIFWWTIRDLNPGPTGYEPAALTNCANGPQIEKSRR